MTGVFTHAAAMMGTVVTVKIVRPGGDPRDVVDRALDWFRLVEASCSRFESSSEVRQLAERPGEAVDVSEVLFEAVRFALAVAEASDGAFDPTIGADLEARGFNREYRSGATIASGVSPDAATTFRDVHLDAARRTITIARPLVLDLGAVAKGLAVDLAARELSSFEHFAIDAGGDLALSGCNEHDEPWAIGIRHPRDPGRLIDTLDLSDCAVCTSGDYELRTPRGHHLIDGRTRECAPGVASVTVVAPSAIAADALGTAAFVLGPDAGLDFLDRQGVAGFMITPSLDTLWTRHTHRDGLRNARADAARGAAILPHA